MEEYEIMYKLCEVLNCSQVNLAKCLGVHIGTMRVSTYRHNLSPMVKENIERVSGMKLEKLIKKIDNQKLMQSLFKVEQKQPSERKRGVKTETLCWTCARSSNKFLKCPKSNKCEPVEGWDADVFINFEGSSKPSYIVRSCPLYMKENYKKAWYKIFEK